jgi:hypothetical protein
MKLKLPVLTNFNRVFYIWNDRTRTGRSVRSTGPDRAHPFLTFFLDSFFVPSFFSFFFSFLSALLFFGAMAAIDSPSASASTSKFLDPSRAIQELANYPEPDGLSLSELMERGPGKSGITYNDFLGQ